MKRIILTLIIVSTMIYSAFPGEGRSEEKDTLWLAGIDMKIGMPQIEVMNNLGEHYDLKKLGDDHWGIFNKPGSPLKLYGEIEFKNGELIRVEKAWGDFYKPDSLELGQTLFSILETYKGNLALIDTKTTTKDPDFRGKAFHLVFLDSGRTLTIIIWEAGIIRPSVLIKEILTSK